jgi:pimeloyl-ACP methyl ester carboxylesterase
VDLPGFNRSSRPSELERYNVQHIVLDMKALVEQLGHKRCVLVAHDWGGAVAWLLARFYPELLEKLVIINSPHPVLFAREMLNNPKQRTASQYMLLFRGPDAEKILAENDYAFFQSLAEGASAWKLSKEDRRFYAEAWSLPGGLTGGLNYYRASFIYPPGSPEEEDRLRNFANLKPEAFSINVPTLVIWGERDPAFVNDNLTGLEDYVSDLNLVRVPDASHWVVREQPERVNALIREFIAKDIKLTELTS